MAAALALFPLAAAAQTADAPAKPDKVEIITLGTGGGPMLRPNRAQTSTALIVRGHVYLIDAGYGTIGKLAATGLQPGKVDAVFITHYHIDHTADLSALVGLRWVFKSFDKMVIAGPPGTSEMVPDMVKMHHVTELARTDNGPLSPPMADVYSGRDFPAATPKPALVYSDDLIRVFAMTNTHYHFAKDSEYGKLARAYGLRIETPDGVIAFTGDTGPSKNMEILAKGADILVSEIIDLGLTEEQVKGFGAPPEVTEALMEHMRTEHLTPIEVGRLAKAAGVKRVVLSHIAPGAPTDKNEDALVAGVKAVYDGPVDAAEDLQHFSIK